MVSLVEPFAKEGEFFYLGDRVARYFGLSRESCILKETEFFYLPIGEGANKPANAPTAAEPKAIRPSGIITAVLMLR